MLANPWHGMINFDSNNALERAFFLCTMRTVFWDFEKHELCMIDQRRLPASLEVVSLHTYLEVAEAIQNMTVRGAPAIGAAAAFGLALAARESNARDVTGTICGLRGCCDSPSKATRPTAVNLAWALERELRVIRTRLNDKNLEELRALASGRSPANCR